MREADRERLADAMRFALDVHGEQTRKGSAVPYASHLLQVSGIVFEAGGDIDQAIAGLLHDALEDSDAVDAAQLEARFGSGVAAIVVACSDPLPGDTPNAKSDWGERKTRYLEQLGAAPERTRLVAASDKLHNLRCTVGELRAEGVAALEKFTASAAQTRWYYEAAHRVLRDALPTPLALEFDALIAVLREHVPDAAPPDPRGV
jgi:(p)ppGpp synthase/HD superfamily hydrolase